MSSKEEDQAVEEATEALFGAPVPEYQRRILQELFRAGRASSCWTKYP